MSTRAIVVDATDVPLGAAERAVAIAAPDAVLRGLGARAIEHPKAALWIEAADDVAAALDERARALAAHVTRRPPTRAQPGTLYLRPTLLAETAWRAGGVDRVAVAVAGAVATPRVLVASPSATVAALVAHAAPRGRAWVALWGGAHGRVVDRDESLAGLVDDERAARLLLVLPAGHALVRRAKLPLATWLRRAQSACAACAMCAPACPASIPVPELLRIVSTGTRARAATRLAAAVDCTACGACDLACPVGLSPARVVADVGRRLRSGGIAAPARRRRAASPLTEEAAIARLGLLRYVGPRPAALTPL